MSKETMLPNFPGDRSLIESSSEDPWEPGEVYDSVLFLLVWLVGSGALLLASTLSWGWGILGMFVFGGHTGWALFRLLRRKARLRITEEGIIDRTFWHSPGLIPWEQIIRVRPARWGMISVEIRDEDEFMAKQSTLANLARIKFLMFNLGPAAIYSLPLQGSRKKLLQALEAGLDAHELARVRQERALGCGAENQHGGTGLSDSPGAT